MSGRWWDHSAGCSCRECHPTGRTHGLRSTYVNARCRCDQCRRAEANYRRVYRARHKMQGAA